MLGVVTKRVLLTRVGIKEWGNYLSHFSPQRGHYFLVYLNQVSHSYDDMVQDKEDYSGTNSEIIIPNLKYFQLQVQKIISVPKNLKNNFVVFFHIFNEVYSCFSI